MLDNADLVLMENKEARWKEAASRARARGVIRTTRKELVATYECLMG